MKRMLNIANMWSSEGRELITELQIREGTEYKKWTRNVPKAYEKNHVNKTWKTVLSFDS